MITINEAIYKYLATVGKSRSEHTVRAYESGLKIFSKTLLGQKIDPTTSPVDILSEGIFSKYIDNLSGFSRASEQLYVQTLKGFYLYLDAEDYLKFNQSKITLIIHQRTRRPTVRIPQFPEEAITKLLEKIQDVDNLITDHKDPVNVLIAYRDRAFLKTLPATGLRIHEICELVRGDFNWFRNYIKVEGKGKKQAIVRITSQAIRAIKDYFAARSDWDHKSGRQVGSLPIFARHDRGANQQTKKMSVSTGRDIVKARVIQFLGEEMKYQITPHSFRHYFVTNALRASGNLAHVQKLARHANIETTKRYTHFTDEELNDTYHKFEEYMEEH